jgi:DNA mismatch endonuclease (patch repair protein)
MQRSLRKKLRYRRFVNVEPKRSRIMSSIRGKYNISTEMILRDALRKRKISGWVRHPKNIFGSPDFYFKRPKVAIFLDGCFWHGCERCGHIPKTRTAFWKEKFIRNKQRSQLVSRELRKHGIRSFRYWEHQLNKPLKAFKVAEKIKTFLQKGWHK